MCEYLRKMPEVLKQTHLDQMNAHTIFHLQDEIKKLEELWAIQ